MSGSERFVLLGLAHPRSAWFRSVGHWANSGALAAEFVKCLSIEEARARLGSGRAYSALLVDAGLPGADRDLVAAANEAGCAVLVVDDGRARRDWLGLGVARVLPAGFGRDDLVTALEAYARLVARAQAEPDSLLGRQSPTSSWRGQVVAVTGPGGTGASVAAMALAQSVADDVRQGGLVLLADLRLHAELAMLHDAGEVAPGVQELVEAHRGGELSADEVRSMVFSVPERHYHLLLGLRRSWHWPVLRPRAFAAGFDALERSFRMVVCDVDPEVEGEEQAGSIDVEERNVMARTATRRAGCVVVVGLPTTKGVSSLVRVVDELLAGGVPPDRLVCAFNQAPRSRRARSALTAAVAELTAGFDLGGSELPTPVFLPERKVDEALRAGRRIPAGIGGPLASAANAILARAEARAPSAVGDPRPVEPGSLGRWAPEALG